MLDGWRWISLFGAKLVWPFGGVRCYAHLAWSTVTVLSFLLIPTWGCIEIKAQTREKTLRAVTDPGVVTTRQGITPAGVQTVFSGKVYDVSFGEDENVIWVLNSGFITRLDWRQNRVTKTYDLESRSGLQALEYDQVGRRVFAAGTMHKKYGEPRKVRLWTADETAVQTWGEPAGSHIAGALTIAVERNTHGERIAVLPLVFDNAVAVFDLERGRLLAKIKTAIAPFGAALDSRGTVAYVTNWGGRLPLPGDETLPSGLNPDADQVVVDKRGIASTGVVNRIDLRAGQVTHTIPVELHPTAIAWDVDRHRIYVANGNKDSISVIDSRLNRVIDSFILQPFAKQAFGIAPTALALSADRETLYVACGGINAVAVLDAIHGRIEGLIPTGWYPNGLALSPRGRFLAVSTLLGVGSGTGSRDDSSKDEPPKRYVHSYRGSVSIIPIPLDGGQLASYTTAVSENNHLPLEPSKVPVSSAPAATPVAIPRRSGDPSLIEHVVYIIKENRTYDQLLGDMAKGNGDPTLVMFGEAITPNHHRISDQFVLLDNFYATGGNSGDGHQWLTQANETDYSMWPGTIGRSYPFDGTDPIAYSASGFIWDAALRMKKTVQVYGEYAGRMEGPPEQRSQLLRRWRSGDDFTREWNIEAPLRPLNRILAHGYPPFDMSIPDVVRAQIFLADLKKWESEGRMPNLVIMLLPSDHTLGTRPLASSPKAMVADNDLALGQIVEALSRSAFGKTWQFSWSKTTPRTELITWTVTGLLRWPSARMYAGDTWIQLFMRSQAF